jgi:hypothetical protein
MNADALRITVAWFPDKGVKGKPALGGPETMTWGKFVSIFEHRREGEKDGPCFVPARFDRWLDGRQVRRLKTNLRRRTAVALDIETSKQTGEVPPALSVATDGAKALGFACLGYSSHTHGGSDVRYRLVLPLSAEIAHDLPAPEVMAERLGLLGVLDLSKIGSASLFYLPSCPYGALDLHQTLVVQGAPIDATWITDSAGALLATRQAEADRIAAVAQTEAATRREARIAAGFNPDDSVIEKIRSRFDLDSILTGHGYAKSGTKYRHPNSGSGCFGADIKVLGGIERVFSHNATDPLHASNLPGWCDGVTALDSVDATIILEFAGDRPRALRELAERFGLTKTAQRKTIAALLFGMIRRQAPQDEIETAACAEGERLGLTREDVCRVALWIASQSSVSREAA